MAGRHRHRKRPSARRIAVTVATLATGGLTFGAVLAFAIDSLGWPMGLVFGLWPAGRTGAASATFIVFAADPPALPQRTRKRTCAGRKRPPPA